MSKAWKILIIVVLLLGLFFRFANLDKKAYSADEVRKLLRLSGTTSKEFINQVYTGEIISAEEILTYEKPRPERNIQDTFHALSGNPEHPPLYFYITYFWMQVFNAPVASRVMSILLGLLAFPSIYWLSIELFNSPLTGWVMMMLVSVSPYHILLAQNTSQYSLWTTITIFSCAALIKALKESNFQKWLIYALSFTLGIYSHLYFIIVAFTHGLYVLILEKFKISKVFLSYLLASLGGIITFLPWLFVIVIKISDFHEKTQYYSQFQVSFLKIITTFKSNVCDIFIDFHGTTRLIEKYLDLLIIILIVYSIYFLIRSTPYKIWLFVVLLIIITPIFHIIPDVFGASIRSLQSRYYVPSFLGIQLSIAYLIASKISSISLPQWSKNIWKFVFISLLTIGITSGIYVAQIHSWEKGTASTQNLDIATIINKSENPLVISTANHSFVLALSHLVNPTTNFQLFQDLEKQKEKFNFEQYINQYSDIFIYFPDQDLIDFINSKNNIIIKVRDNKRIPVLISK